MGDIYGKGPRGKATRLHAQLVRERGYCENDHPDAKHSPYLQCAHIISRRFASTRTDETNAFCLCATCHRYFEEWPLEFARFTIEKIGEEKYEELRKKSLSIKKMDWDAEVIRLKELM